MWISAASILSMLWRYPFSRSSAIAYPFGWFDAPFAGMRCARQPGKACFAGA
jgi:hypothetical protein